MPLDPRKTVFVGGVPRPLKAGQCCCSLSASLVLNGGALSNDAVELAMIMDRLYGGVCYAGIDTDPELKYPKGAGRVAFSNQQSYIAAISARFVQLQHGDIEKRVSAAADAPQLSLSFAAGRSEALCPGRSNLRRVSGGQMWRQVRAVLLCKRDLLAVLLRALLGDDPLAAWTRVPQAAGERGRRSSPCRALPLVLRLVSIGTESPNQTDVVLLLFNTDLIFFSMSVVRSDEGSGRWRSWLTGFDHDNPPRQARNSFSPGGKMTLIFNMLSCICCSAVFTSL